MSVRISGVRAEIRTGGGAAAVSTRSVPRGMSLSTVSRKAPWTAEMSPYLLCPPINRKDLFLKIRSRGASDGCAESCDGGEDRESVSMLCFGSHFCFKFLGVA